MKEKIAVLTDNNFVILRLDNKLEIIKHDINEYINVDVLIDKAIKYNVFNLWVTPYSNISGKFVYPNFLQCSNEYGVKYPKQEDVPSIVTSIDGSKYFNYAKVYKKGEDDIVITVPEFNDKLWKFNEYEDVSPNDLIIMLVALREMLPVDLYNSPTKIGTELISELTSNQHAKWLEATNFKLDDRPLAISLVWRCQGKPTPKKYLHVYDKRGAFLSSYNSTLLGSGDTKQYGSIPFDSKHVGIWHAEITGESKYNGKMLPLPYNEYAGYYWTPELKISQMLGYNIHVLDAELWEFNKDHKINQCHYILREWAKKLWESRVELKQKWLDTNKFGYYMAYDTIKKIYTETGGRLAYSGEAKYESEDRFKRHDWFSMVVADTRLKVLYQINKLVDLGYYPIMVVTDAIYYLSDNRDYKTAIPTILDNENNLGGYTHKYSVEYNQVQELFETDVSPIDIATTLNQLERDGLTW